MSLGGIVGIETDSANFGIRKALSSILQNGLQSALVAEILNSENAKEREPRLLPGCGSNGSYARRFLNLIVD